MFQTKLLIITFLMVHTIQSSAVGRNRISRIDTLRTDSTQGNRFDKSLQADPRRQSSDSAATNSLAGETTNNVVDNNRANIKNVNIGAANAEPNIQQGDALWNSTNFDLVQDSKTDYVNDTAGTVDRPTRIPTNGTQRMDERKMAMKPDIRTAGAEIKGTAQEVQTAINGSNEMPLSEEAQHNLSKTSPGGPQQTGLSVQAMEELARLAKQNSKTNTTCSKQCSPFWLSAIELSVGQLPADHAICQTGNYTTCGPAESVCDTVPTKIVCCPMECLRPIQACYTGPDTANMCIPLDVTHWITKMRKQGASILP